MFQFCVDCVYTDSTKVLDTVNIGGLLAKLGGIGVRNPLLDGCLKSLENGRQIVKIVSVLVEATSGVPQRSHLSPILFYTILTMLMLLFSFKIFVVCRWLKALRPLLFQTVFVHFEKEISSLNPALGDIFLTKTSREHLITSWCKLHIYHKHNKKHKHTSFKKKEISKPVT